MKTLSDDKAAQLYWSCVEALTTLVINQSDDRLSVENINEAIEAIEWAYDPAEFLGKPK